MFYSLVTWTMASVSYLASMILRVCSMARAEADLPEKLEGVRGADGESGEAGVREGSVAGAGARETMGEGSAAGAGAGATIGVA